MIGIFLVEYPRLTSSISIIFHIDYYFLAFDLQMDPVGQEFVSWMVLFKIFSDLWLTVVFFDPVCLLHLDTLWYIPVHTIKEQTFFA